MLIIGRVVEDREEEGELTGYAPRELVITSNRAELPAVLAFVRQAGLDAGLDEDAVFACELSTDEACTNIIEHAYEGRPEGRIEIACYVSADSFVIRLHDYGRPFDPDKVPAPSLSSDLARRRPGGLGLHFMRSLMDEVVFEFDARAGNTLTMKKRLPRLED